MGRRTAGAFAALWLLAASTTPALAAEDQDVVAFCGPGPADESVTIADVDAFFDILLADGRRLRLAGLALPRPRADAPDPARDFRRVLMAWAAEGPAKMRILAPEPDRWGRLSALLFRPGAPEPSAAAMLLEAGLARARPEAPVHPCFAMWLGAEARAREGRRGLWADPREAPLRASDAEGLARANGGFAILEGILSVHAARGGSLYLTLDRDRWAFAAVLARRDAARLGKAGFDVADYAGTPVRLRGDLDDRDGTRIRFTDPDQLESLEPGAFEAPPP